MQFSLARLAFPKWRYLLGVLILLVGGWYFFLGQGKSVDATFTVSSGDFNEQINVSGTVTATRNVALGFATNGRIAGTYAKVGQHVRAGAILAEIENGDLVATLAQKQSALIEAQADLALLQAGTRPEELAVAVTAVTNAEAALVDAIQNAYTTSDDAVHNKIDIFFTNPRISPELSFNIANASLEAIVEQDRLSIETMLTSWALLVTKLSNENAIHSAKQAQTYLAQVTTLLANANAALNQGIPDQTTSAATLSSYATTLATARTN